MEDQQTFTKKRSESLTREEYKALKAYRKQFTTEIDCALSLRIDRGVLGRVLLTGSGSPDSIDKIRVGIKNGSQK